MDAAAAGGSVFTDSSGTATDGSIAPGSCSSATEEAARSLVADVSRLVGTVGVAGVADGRSLSRFFSSVRRKAFRVVRSALLGLQRSGEMGL